MASKYAHLKSKLPSFEVEPAWQEKIDAFKREYGENITDANVSVLAVEFAKHKQEKEALEEQISARNVALEAISQMLVERLEADENQNVQLSSGATVFLSYDPYPTVEDKDALLAWIKKKKMNSLLSLNYQTLRGIVGDIYASGEKIEDATHPVPGVKTFLKVSARIRKG